MQEENPTYAEHVLDHYQDPYHRESVERATHLAEEHNPLCGDTLRVELRLDRNGGVADAGFDGEGCVISQASASMLMEKITEMSAQELEAFSADEMLNLFGPSLLRSRQKCCLLPWRVLQSARQSPVGGEDEDADGPNFGGPSLSEEC